MVNKKITKHITLAEKSYQILEKIKEEKNMSYSAYINFLIQEAEKNV